MDEEKHRKYFDAIEHIECVRCATEERRSCYACTMNKSSIVLLQVEINRLRELVDHEELVVAATSLLKMLPEDSNAWEDAAQARQISDATTRLRCELAKKDVPKRGTNNYHIFMGS